MSHGKSTLGLETYEHLCVTPDVCRCKWWKMRYSLAMLSVMVTQLSEAQKMSRMTLGALEPIKMGMIAVLPGFKLGFMPLTVSSVMMMLPTTPTMLKKDSGSPSGIRKTESSTHVTSIAAGKSSRVLRKMGSTLLVMWLSIPIACN